MTNNNIEKNTNTITSSPLPEREAQIYIACLSSYNGGILYGKWITPSTDEEDLIKQIQDILKNSPMYDGSDDMEWAVHDYEDFPNLGEYPNIEKIIEVQEAITEHGKEIVNAFLEHFEIDLLDRISDAYYGKYDSFGEFAEQLADETMLIECPEHIKHYFDYDQFERDMKYDYDESDCDDGQVIIFNSNF